MTKYRTIVCDPPWPHKDTGPRTAPENGGWAGDEGTIGRPCVVPYERMPLEEIAALPVRDLAESNAHLYLWTTNGFLRPAFEIMEGWGFRFSALLTWCKTPMGLGFGGTFVNTTEFVIFARRGSLRALGRQDSTWWQWPRSSQHSRKPEAFLDMVEQTSPAPRLELFARRARFGWDYWGDESLGTAQLPEQAT